MRFPDARVRDYPLMQSPVHMTTILLGYVAFSVYVGPRVMANRKPFHLNTAMIIYNVSMVLLNAYIVYEVRRKGICLRSFTTGVMSVLKAAGVGFFFFFFFYT